VRREQTRARDRVKTNIHLCQDIEGAILNWSAKTWCAVGKYNNMTAREVKRMFIQYLREGKKVLPISGECEGFSYETGCPGHDVVE